MNKLITTFAAMIFAAASSFAQVSFGDAGIFNQGWTFHLGDVENAEKPEFDDSRWTKTELPHDWSVKQHLSPDLASCTGYLPGGIGWYRKSFNGSLITKDNVYVYFEGVYNRSKVYINGHLLGERPSGYASFMYDITPYVNRNGDNVIAVRADHSRYADSRFYTGSGIYRNVWLIQAGKTHFAQWGVGYNATNVSDTQATMNVDAEIEGLGAQKCRLLLELKDKNGNTVAKTTANAAAKQTVSFKVKNPHRWDIKDPYLYTLEASILSGKAVLDKTTINVGIRTLEFDPDKGFALNGKWMKVKGVCLHHDAGVLGAAVPDDVWERRLRNLQAIGANAIRTSHNPQTPAFYDLCDKLGLLVMDEAFAEWEYAKKKWISGWNKGTRDQQTLTEVINLSEYPTPMCANFDEEFLQVPEEIKEYIKWPGESAANTPGKQAKGKKGASEDVEKFAMTITGESMGMKYVVTARCVVEDKKVRYIEWSENESKK